MHNKHALTNLKNRYRAVLKKCHLINTFGSLALVASLCLSVNTAQAADGAKGPDVEVSNQTFTYDSTSTNFEQALSRGEAATGSDTGGDGGNVTANNNTTTTSGTVNEQVYGGRAGSYGGEGPSGTGGNGGTATANYNTVTVNGTVEFDVSGGSVYSSGGEGPSGTGGNGATATANYNTVTVNGTVKSSVNPASVYVGDASSYGGYSVSGTGGNSGTATASYNTANVNGTVGLSVYGGFASSYGGDSDSGTGGNAGTATANYNTVNVYRTVEHDVYGGDAQSGGGTSNTGTGGNGGTATASYNTVNVSGTVGGWLYGGRAQSGGGASNTGTAGNAGTATASYNTVHLNNATIGKTGSSYIIGGVATGNASSRAENNTVILSNNFTFNGTTLKIGGGSSNYVAIASNPDFFNGNTLILNQYKGNTPISEVANFEKYAFVLDADRNEHQALKVANLYLGNNVAPLLATKFAYVSDISSLSLSNYNINETILLIDSTNIHDTISNDNQEVKGTEGAFVESLWRVNQTADDITATLISKQAGNKAEHFVSAHGETVASMLTISNDALLIGIESARDNVQLASVNAGLSAGSHMKQNVFMPFASVYGGYSAVGDDNNIDINSLSFVGGIGYTSYFSNSELLLAAFFETGHGSYNSYDNNIHSEGDANYYGGGLFARFDMYTGAGNAYIEASAKVGSMHYDYYTDDIKTAHGSPISYDVDSLYYGAHAGLGYVWNINDALALDMSAKYFYAHQDGFDENIGGNNFDVDALDSHRIKAGARLSYTMPTSYNFTFAPYMGLYYEHEFNDDISATVDNFAVPSDDDSNGSTGVLELGVKLASTMGLSANIGMEASLGARESVMGKLEFKYVF